MLGLLWVLLSFAWWRSEDPQAVVGCGLAGSIVIVGYAIHRLITRRWQPRFVAACAALVTGMVPGLDVATGLKDIPPGFVAILCSFALFVAGTIAALTRPRWQRNRSGNPL